MDKSAPKPPRDRAQMMQKRQEAYKKCVDKLGVSAAKKKQLLAIDKKYADKGKALFEAKGTPDQKRSKFEANRKARQAEVDKVLTKDQQKKLQDCLREQRKNMPGGPWGRPGGMGGPGGPPHWGPGGPGAPGGMGEHRDHKGQPGAKPNAKPKSSAKAKTSK